jgi:5-hydroxyisourate hydrolase
MSISTHVLDAVNGRPAVGIAVRLGRRDDASGEWSELSEHVTDADGRVPQLAPEASSGDYRLVFATAEYFGGATFYPEVTVAFRVSDPAAHHHVPLLLSPYAYSTYRGS